MCYTGGYKLFILGRQEDLIKKIEAMDSLDGNGLMWLALQDMSLPAFQSGAKTVSSIIWTRISFSSPAGPIKELSF